MTLRHRLTLVLPLALLMAAAVARAELGADTEASVLFTPAFTRALPVAVLVGWFVAPGFGHAGPGGWLRAGALSALVLPTGPTEPTTASMVSDAAVSALVLAAAGLAATLILPAVQPEGGPAALLTALPDYPLAWGSALFGWGAAQLLALRQRRDQSRK